VSHLPAIPPQGPQHPIAAPHPVDCWCPRCEAPPAAALRPTPWLRGFVRVTIPGGPLVAPEVCAAAEAEGLLREAVSIWRHLPRFEEPASAVFVECWAGRGGTDRLWFLTSGGLVSPDFCPECGGTRLVEVGAFADGPELAECDSCRWMTEVRECAPEGAEGGF
jgi:hypothetical protein